MVFTNHQINNEGLISLMGRKAPKMRLDENVAKFLKRKDRKTASESHPWISYIYNGEYVDG